MIQTLHTHRKIIIVSLSPFFPLYHFFSFYSVIEGDHYHKIFFLYPCKFSGMGLFSVLFPILEEAKKISVPFLGGPFRSSSVIQSA
jgi:hypothetical protein